MAGPEENDELWGEDPVVQALRAAGSDDELAEQDTYLAMFRAARHEPPSAVRVVGRRIGLGAGSAAAVVVLTAGAAAAAAWTSVLPDPVQRIAHSVLGPVGVPAPEKHQPHRPAPAPGATAGPVPSSGPSTPGDPTSGPSVAVTAPAVPQPSLTAAAPAPGAPTPSLAGTPSSAPTPTGAPVVSPVPGAFSIAVEDSTVTVGKRLTVSGVLTTAEGEPVPDHAVRLSVLLPGQDWARVARGRTDEQGRVTLTSPAVESNLRIRLAADVEVYSSEVRIVVRPTLTVAVSRPRGRPPGASTLRISTVGARSGDTVTVYRRAGRSLVVLGRTRVDDAGNGVLVIRTKVRRAQVLVRLAATELHGQAETTVLVRR